MESFSAAVRYRRRRLPRHRRDDHRHRVRQRRRHRQRLGRKVPAGVVIVGSDTILFARVGWRNERPGRRHDQGRVGHGLPESDRLSVSGHRSGTVQPTIVSVSPQRAKSGKKLDGGQRLRRRHNGNGQRSSVTYAIPSDNLMYVIVPATAKAGLDTIVVTNAQGSAKVVSRRRAKSSSFCRKPASPGHHPYGRPVGYSGAARIRGQLLGRNSSRPPGGSDTMRRLPWRFSVSALRCECGSRPGGRPRRRIRARGAQAFDRVGRHNQKVSIVTVTAGKPSELLQTVQESLVPVGTVTFKVTNMGVAYHNFKICTIPVPTARAPRTPASGPRPRPSSMDSRRRSRSSSPSRAITSSCARCPATPRQG